MVSLSTAAVVEDLRATVLSGDAPEAGCDLSNRGIPADLVVSPIRSSAQRRPQTVATVLVVIEPHRLVARVALRARMGLVPTNAAQRAPLELDFYAAVAFAEDACSRLPFGRGHLGLPSLISARSNVRS